MAHYLPKTVLTPSTHPDPSHCRGRGHECAPASYRSENVPSGSPHPSTAEQIASLTPSEIPGWPGWALAITGHPAAKAWGVDAAAPTTDLGKHVAAQRTL